MASPVLYPGGFNLTGTVFAGGPTVAQLYPSYISGSVQWLDTIGGNNGNAGTQPELPVATLAQAVTNSAANGMIIIGAGSAQTLAGAQTINLAGLTIWGCGSGTARPRYTANGAISMWDITAAGVRIRNIYFPASTAAPTNRVAFTSTNGEVKDCYFECGAFDTGRALRIHTGANSTRVEGTSFVTTASRPAIGLEVSAAVSDVTLVNNIFDGGSFGWTDYALKVSAAATRIVGEGNSMLRRSDVGITVTATSYQLFGITGDGTSQVSITA